MAPALPLYQRQDHENGSATAREGQNEDADHLFTSGEICFLSFDIEYGGDCRGIVHELCAEFAPMVIKETSNVSNATDKAALIQLHSDCFHMYVNVNPGDRAIWDEHATAVHGVKATDECMCMKSKMRSMV